MISKVTPSFWRTLARLGGEHQAAARRAFRLFSDNPDHASLRFKKLAGHDAIWSVRVTLSIRAVGERHGDTITWVWVGPHKEFDQLFG